MKVKRRNRFLTGYNKRDKTLKFEKVKREKISLKNKLIFSHILLTIIPILIIVITLTAQASSSLMEKVNSSNLAYVTKVTKIFDGNIKSLEDNVRSLITDVDFNNTISKDKTYYSDVYEMGQDRTLNFTTKIRNMQNTNTNINNIYLIKEQEIIGTTNFDEKKFIEDFYASNIAQTVIEAKNSNVWFYDLYETKDIYVMRSINSVATGKFVGVLVFQVDKEMFIEDLQSDFGSLAKLALVDSLGRVVVTTQQDEFSEITYFDDLDIRMKQNSPVNGHNVGTFITNNEGAIEISVMYGQCLNHWIYILQIPVSEFLGDIQDIEDMAIVLTIIIVLVAILVGTWMAISITKPINYLRKKIKLVEQGDLTVKSKYSGKYEVGQLSLSFNHMTNNMKGLIEEVRKAVEQVSNNSNELKHIASNSAYSSKEVVLAVESVTSGAIEQSQEAEQASNVIKELIHQFNEAEEHFGYVVEATNKTNHSSQNAKAIMLTLNTSTNDSIELSRSIQSNMQYLVKRFTEMSSIAGMIDGISEQTNLLALNAAIEAARAGEHGKGFAVVADEIRKLSVQSSNAVKQISDIIQSVSEETTKTNKMIEDGSVIYEQQEYAVNDTEIIFEEIVGNMNTINEQVSLVYKLLEGLEHVQGNATESITSIAAIAEETAASIEEVLATGQEQMSSADQLVHMSTELSKVIVDMENQVKKFRIEG